MDKHVGLFSLGLHLKPEGYRYRQKEKVVRESVAFED